ECKGCEDESQTACSLPRSLSTIELPTYLQSQTAPLRSDLVIERPLSPILVSNILMHNENIAKKAANDLLDQQQPLPLDRLLLQSLRRKSYFDRLVRLYPELQIETPLLVPAPDASPAPNLLLVEDQPPIPPMTAPADFNGMTPQPPRFPSSDKLP